MSRVGFSIDKGIVDEYSGELVEPELSLNRIDLLAYLWVYHNSIFDLVDGWYLWKSYKFPLMN